MKYLKMLGLMALAAAALMAFAGSAAATTLTKGNGEGVPVGEKITAESEEGAIAGTKHVVLTLPWGLNIQCNSHVEGEVTNAGSSSTTVSGKVSQFSITNCTNGYAIDVTMIGSLEIHTTSGGNAIVTASGFTVDLTNSPLGTCTYQTGSNLAIGTLTGAPSTTSHATFDISATIPRHGTNAFCGATATWEGNYIIRVPTGLKTH